MGQGEGGCALLLGAGLTLTLVAVDPLMATPDEAAAEINKFTGGKATEGGKISIDLPEIAENGNTVPLSIKVDSAMKADDYVSEIRVIADGNPFPGIVKFHLTPIVLEDAYYANIPTRRRLQGETQSSTAKRLRIRSKAGAAAFRHDR